MGFGDCLTARAKSHHSTYKTQRLRQRQNPTWRLEDENEIDLSGFQESVLDVSFNVLPDLRCVATAPSFTCLTILRMRETGLEDIRLLQSCTALVHIDLSSNEIIDLVGDDFWASFPNLLVLLLHGNKVKDWRATVGLSQAPRLTYLTLFYNPVSKTKSYRTFIANSCERLRGLDRHTISDEEVIEGAKFFRRSRYRTCSGATALPQALLKGLTDFALLRPRNQHENGTQNLTGRTPGQAPLACNIALAYPSEDSIALASVVRRVGLLRRFHARQSPVIIGQRLIRRFLLRRVRLAVIVKIQAFLRSWFVRRRAMEQLRELLRKTGELYLVQEMLTPTQLRSLVHFQRYILDHLRANVRATCVRRLERFVYFVKRRFSSFVRYLERAEVGGVIVAANCASDLVAAATKALLSISPYLTKEEAARQTMMMVTVVTNCRLLRPFSYVRMSDWPFLREDADTDGIFVMCSSASCESRSKQGESISGGKGAVRPLSGLHDRGRKQAGLFEGARIKSCKIRSRGASFYRVGQRETNDTVRQLSRRNSNQCEQLWVFCPEDTRMLARVLCTLRNNTWGKSPVPYILERHILRCAAATRVQAAWRGHVSRWNMLIPLTSCLIVSRAAICLQRWWRYSSGLGLRLRRCRRLWALATAVSCPVMFIELDVFFTLTRGWRVESGTDGSLLFASQNGNSVVAVKEEALAIDKDQKECVHHDYAASSSSRSCLTRRLPLWASGTVVPNAMLSQVGRSRVLHQVGKLLTEGVQAKRVVWPIAAMADKISASEVEGEREAIDRGTTTSFAQQSDGGRANTLESSSTEIWAGRTASTTTATSPCRNTFKSYSSGTDNVFPLWSGPPIDLRDSHAGVDIVELTFSSVREARARALLLAVATEECGVAPNRPVAQLMTLGMLRRAAGGRPGRAVPTLVAPVHGYQGGDNVEMSMLRLSEGFAGCWFPGIIARDNGDGTFKVILDNGLVEARLSPACLRPYDRTGKECALVALSHLPSRWQRSARTLLSPSDRVELELLRRALPPTSSVLSEHTMPNPIVLVSNAPRLKKSEHARLFADKHGKPGGVRASDLHSFEKVAVRKHDPESRPTSAGNHRGLDSAQAGVSSAHAGVSLPHWAGSMTMSTARADRPAGAGWAGDRATTTTTWVPGNRFRRDLEKLVSLAAQQAKDAAARRDHGVKRQAVVQMKSGERMETTPRERLERLKAAEMAMFRREVDELRERATAEKLAEEFVRTSAAAQARDNERESAEIFRADIEARRLEEIVDTRRRKEKQEFYQRKEKTRREGDRANAKQRERVRQVGRARQAHSLAQSRAFTSNASELMRHVRKHTAVCCKAQEARGMRKWVKKQRAHKDEMRRRLLERVKDLQEAKRIEAKKQGQVLAARARARRAMDDAVVRHRVGDPTLSTDELACDALQVMRPSSTQETREIHSSTHATGKNTDCRKVGCDGTLLYPDEDVFLKEATEGDDSPNLSLEQRRLACGGTGDGIPGRRESLLAGVAQQTSGVHDTHPNAGLIPTKPSETRRPRSQQKVSRRLQPSRADAGKTVVVLASVPNVSTSTRSNLTRGPPSALFGSRSNQSMSSAPQPQQEQRGSCDNTVSAAVTAQQSASRAPWPMGRRCW